MKIRAIFAIGFAALTFSVADALSAHDGKAQTVSTGFQSLAQGSAPTPRSL